MRKIYICFAFFTALLFLNIPSVFSQVSYNDVAVIVNQNDSVSIAIGNYFMQKRNIPAINKIVLDVPAIEEVNDSVFSAMRTQIENYITANNLVSTLNYLVTTKGCPLKILRVENDTDNCNASVESELMMILGAYNNFIGSCNSVDQINSGQFLVNPYFQATGNFSRNSYEIFLVTRLDGYTLQDVYTLIDRGGPDRFVNKDSSLFVFDQDPAWSSQPLNTELATVTPVLTGRGWHVLLNTDTVFVTHQSKVLGYHSWGSNDSHAAMYSTNAKPMNSWLAGSLAETNVSTSARSFQPGTAYGQSLIADLIAEGVTGVKGYVYEPFTIAIAHPTILWDMYTHLDNSGHPLYNMAESYFAASEMIGWKDVVIGDPKTSITTDPVYSLVSSQEKKVIYIFPNPVLDKLYVSGNPLAAGGELLIYNLIGAVCYHSSTSDLLSGTDISFLSSGIYFVKITGEKEETYFGKFVKK